MPVSSRKTRRVGSQVGAAACHTTRAAATSGRSCSEGRTVFFDGHVQIYFPHTAAPNEGGDFVGTQASAWD